MREEVESRPAAILFLGFVLGLIAIAFPLACLFVGVLAFWIRLLPRKWLLAGSFVAGLVLSPAPQPPILFGVAIHGIGTVTSVPMMAADSQTFEVAVGGRTLLATATLEPGLMLGDRVGVSGIAKPTAARGSKFAGFERVQGRLQLEHVDLILEGSWVAHLADRWRRSFLQFLDRSLSPRESNLVDALCFNGRRMLDSQTREEMAGSGLVHMISASGLQVFVFGMLVSMVLRFFPVHRWVQVVVLAGVLVVYALGAGLQPQIVRAAAMTVLGLSAYLVRREPDALSALCLSGIGYLLWRPESVYGMPFQLSFVTVGAVALFYQRDHQQLKSFKAEVIRNTNDFAKLSLVVLLATLPLVAYYLGVVSGVTLLANLMVCWCLPLLIGTAFVSYVVSFAIPSIGESMATHVLSPMIDWIYSVMAQMGGGWGAVQVPDFNGLWLLVFYGGWLLTYRRHVVQP